MTQSDKPVHDNTGNDQARKPEEDHIEEAEIVEETTGPGAGEDPEPEVGDTADAATDEPGEPLEDTPDDESPDETEGTAGDEPRLNRRPSRNPKRQPLPNPPPRRCHSRSRCPRCAVAPGS